MIIKFGFVKSNNNNNNKNMTTKIDRKMRSCTICNTKESVVQGTYCTKCGRWCCRHHIRRCHECKCVNICLRLECYENLCAMDGVVQCDSCSHAIFLPPEGLEGRYMPWPDDGGGID